MKMSDKWLLGIIIGTMLLVAVAFTVTLTRPKPTYRPENTPQGVAFNYLLALKQYDYIRAYHYLSPKLPGYPASVDAFTSDIEKNKYQFHFDNLSLDTGDSRNEKSTSHVTIRKTYFSSDGLTGSRQYSSTFEVTLHQEGDTWKITSADEYWLWQWENAPDRK